MKILAFIIVGISCGMLFARYQVCAASAVRNFLGYRRTEKLILFVCIIVASAILHNFFIGLGLLTETVKPFVPPTLVGGILFGIGMVIAGGSTEGILYRVGEGNVPAVMSTLGMVGGMGTFGFVIAVHFTSRPPHFVSSTIVNFLGIPPLIFSLVLAGLSILAVTFMRARSPEVKRKRGLVLAIACIVALNGAMLTGLFSIARSECQAIEPIVLQDMIDSGEELVILDVRAKPMYDQGHIKGSIALESLPDGLKSMREHKDKPVVVVCGMGIVSKITCIRLNKQGFKKVYNLNGGLKNWSAFQWARRSAE